MFYDILFIRLMKGEMCDINYIITKTVNAWRLTSLSAICLTPVDFLHILEPMKITIKHHSIIHFDCDTVIVNLFQGVKSPGGATGIVDKALGGVVSRLIKKHEITGKIGEVTSINTLGKMKAERVLVVGLGESRSFNLDRIRKAAGAAAQQARRQKAQDVATIVHGAGIGGLKAEDAAQALVEGSILALYRFSTYKKSSENDLRTFTIVDIDKRKISRLQRGATRGEIIARSQNIARDLINEPANTMTPLKLHQRLQRTIKQLALSKTIQCQVLDKQEMRRLGMNALLSVSQGSTNNPQCIILRAKTAKKPLICLIGKTVTFDSGGISLKPANSMARMKGDMAGGAAVIGATLALAQTKTKMNLMSIIPAVENMPSGSASRPGDIVKAMNGKTIEIISTDAEGRMTLADSLCYAENKGAKVLVDIATLTGGCVVALGELTAAVMGNDQRLIDKLMAISELTGEKHWQLPLFDEYKALIKSTIADVKNAGGRQASAITAGIFLSNFVEKARWLHIDIAGKEFTEKPSHYTPAGGTGFGVRTLFQLVKALS